MIRAATYVLSRHASTGRQRRLRRASRRLPLQCAIRCAVDLCYGFQGRSIQGKALWSTTERVWMGPETFLHWSLCLEDIDIPWAVATAVGAPQDVEQLRDAVHTELVAYWADRLQALPCQECPAWLPLP
jgi:hypothetical protein